MDQTYVSRVTQHPEGFLLLVSRAVAIKIHSLHEANQMWASVGGRNENTGLRCHTLSARSEILFFSVGLDACLYLQKAKGVKEGMLVSAKA